MSTQVKAEMPGPIIVGEDVGIPHHFGASHDSHDQSLVSPHAYQNLVSMATFEKSQDLSFDYPSSSAPRPTDNSNFFEPGFPPAPYVDTRAHVPSGLPDANDMPLLSSSSYESHDSFSNGELSPYQHLASPNGPREMPHVTSYSPSQGPAGRKLCVYIDCRGRDVESAGNFPAVTFGSRRCSGLLTRLAPQQGQSATHVLTVDVPPFDSTSSALTQVALSLDMGDSVLTSMIGSYSYTDATSYSVSTPPPIARKRRLSVDTSLSCPSKRSSPVPMTADYSVSPPSQQGMSPYSPTPQSSNYAYSQTPSRPRPFPQQTQSALSTPRYGVSPQLATAHLSVGPSSIPYGGHGSYGTDGGAGPTSSPMSHQSMVPNISNGSANPALVRTSTLHYDSGLPATQGVSSGFNPYSMYSSNSKAILKLDGDLNSMTQLWTPQELAMQRRLVRFRRSQSGSNINASFEPVTQEDHARAPGHIYVNCIWWKEKQECYITSVDTIQLLESLVAVRFTVEEKNRIRRNLEGFRPATVSKTRPDCEEFFKTIMGFPNPKPRNIEKDVKVFPWKILAGALKKIIGKYSASYSSTSGPNGVSGVGAFNHMRQPSSSRSSTPGGGGMQYAPMPMQMLPSNSPTPQQQPQQPQSQPMVHGPMNNGMLPSGVPQNMSWHQASANYAGDMSGGRQSLDFSNFMDGSASQAGQQQHPAGEPYAPGPYRYERIPSISQSLPYMGY